ncbi:DUF2637 domain-containing protein [Streptomyces sp. NBC_00207]|uniref:DUF2637 domain-containing protein n=1 Tax=Streptomyces sp. NBC_00207 TaxID=2903635 RepID=UPI0032523EF4
MNSPSPPGARDLRNLPRPLLYLGGLVVFGAVIIAAIGFAGSYTAVRDLAERKGFGSFARAFPVGIDAGIVVLLALDLLLTWLRIPYPLLRQTAWFLTAATIAFNGAAAWPDLLGVGMHAVMPVLFVVTVEAARHAVGRLADITADKHMEGVRLVRWLLSPVPTFKLWRRMKLWELRSYERAVGMEQDRLIYQARLEARYGRRWRRKAPVELLMPLRLAKLGVPLQLEGDAIPSPDPMANTGLAADPDPDQIPALEPAPADPDPDLIGGPTNDPDQAPDFPLVGGPLPTPTYPDPDLTGEADQAPDLTPTKAPDFALVGAPTNTPTYTVTSSGYPDPDVIGGPLPTPTSTPDLTPTNAPDFAFVGAPTPTPTNTPINPDPDEIGAPALTPTPVVVPAAQSPTKRRQITAPVPPTKPTPPPKSGSRRTRAELLDLVKQLDPDRQTLSPNRVSGELGVSWKTARALLEELGRLPDPEPAPGE